jgi:acyl carrier protein|tara:strand:- start:353 stop:589 length:237 start_codon:yes stop_codon:yes gene_type:complete
MIHDQIKLTHDLVEIVKKLTRSSQVDSNSSTENLPQWDSLSYMAIISEIEVIYEVSVTQDNIEKFDSIKSIAKLILQK